MELNNKEFVQWVRKDLQNQNEVALRYKDFSFVLQPSGKSIEVYSHGKTLASYDSFDDFLHNFLIKEHLFMNIVDEIDFDD